MKQKRVDLNIDEVEFDDANPRIKGALEKYGDNINAEQIHFALQNSADDGARNASGFHRLKVSIRADGGITEPIKVVKKDGRTICIDGNTRLAIYKEFNEDSRDKKWQTIPAVALEDAEQIDIEKIRVTAHLVGARPWPAYEKAKYLKYLRYEQLMDYDEMIALCGGNKREIEEQMDAFDDMNKYYRDKVEDADFRIDRFSGFVEFQKRGIKEAILEAGFGLADFGNWIKDQKIGPLADVRLLPKVLRDEEARNIFVNGRVNSIKKAARLVDDKNRDENEETQSLKDASLDALAYAFRIKLEQMILLDLDALKENDETKEILQSLSERLIGILDYVGDE